jgi:photosystem II stability/assembly factor-like uncharacterized protein
VPQVWGRVLLGVALVTGLAGCTVAGGRQPTTKRPLVSSHWQVEATSASASALWVLAQTSRSRDQWLLQRRGTHWHVVMLPPPAPERSRGRATLVAPAMAWINSRDGVIVGWAPQISEEVVWVTTDAGRRWSVTRPLPNLPAGACSSGTQLLSAQSTLWLLCVGEAAGMSSPVSLYRSLDGGARWFAVWHATSPLTAVLGWGMTSGGTGVLTFFYPGPGVRYATSRDDGHHWSFYTRPLPATATSGWLLLATVARNRIWLLGPTSRHRVQWAILTGPTLIWTEGPAVAVSTAEHALSQTDGFVVGKSFVQDTLLLTLRHGIAVGRLGSPTMFWRPAPGGQLSDGIWVSPDQGWVVGQTPQGSTLWYTTTGGRRWQRIAWPRRLP